MAMRSSSPFTVPPTQNTAPVLEFRCLYTHDLKRKQKRWQDGRLKLHTFNRRVMVYADDGSYVGDKHGGDGVAVEEGAELRLDAAVLVQVEEKVGKTETDLAPLFSWKGAGGDAEGRREKEKAQSPVRVRQPTVPRPNVVRPVVAARHKSLQSLLGRRTGPSGKAVMPVKSPYEQRREEQENVLEGSQPAKRQRIGGDVDTSVLAPSKAGAVPLEKYCPTVDEIIQRTKARAAETQLPKSAPPAQHVEQLAVKSPPRGVASISNTVPDIPPHESLLQGGEGIGQQHKAKRKAIRIVRPPPRSMLMCHGGRPDRDKNNTMPAVPADHRTGAVAVTQHDPTQAPRTRESRVRVPPSAAREPADASDRSDDAFEEITTADVRHGSPFVSASALRLGNTCHAREVQPPTKITPRGKPAVARKARKDASGKRGAAEEPKKDTDVGPWSTEAGDLFDWRPPGRRDLGTT